jgi:hypothetical protein
MHPASSLAPSFPPTNTRHLHPISSSESHTKCPNRFFDPMVKCTVARPMTYSYTICRNSAGRRAKNTLWSCASVRVSCALRSAVECTRSGPDREALENGLRERLGAARVGMSCGIQRRPGRWARNLGAIWEVGRRSPVAIDL